MEITHEIACKILEIVDAGLISGLGEPIPGQMCVEAAGCYAMGQEHGDEPECVSSALRAFKIGLNDASWSGPSARATGLRRLALIQLGSRECLDDILFATELAKLANIWANNARSAAARSAACAARSAACAAHSAACAAHYAACAAHSAACAAHYAACAAAGGAADAAADMALSAAAEDVVQLLIRLNAPGAKWLELAPL